MNNLLFVFYVKDEHSSIITCTTVFSSYCKKYRPNRISRIYIGSYIIYLRTKFGSYHGSVLEKTPPPGKWKIKQKRRKQKRLIVKRLRVKKSAKENK
jgi:hypothetical protein